MNYPILVEKFAGDQAFIVVCEDCGYRAKLDGEEVAGEVGYRAGEGLLNCMQDCGGSMTYAYEEAPKCKNCGKLGHWDKVLDYCCSRSCKLQAEYAASLPKRAV